ncbi:SufD family Fe-S cluster assembly protein [Ideonella sp.]|uniref:SufD family Fe-S cluster assembly protein n=1 Tax=Ideonella sp. TaxID=1929293 RepID=UPI002B45B374|nr:SufD family Fe-S cluster assembly protein [Ideonella sp.]HJV69550.1 SufD family Fe-S cluster assembly protein [Ideonella sp.]
MDLSRADMLAARHRLDTRGWIPRNAENFRHLPPPGAAVWLGDEGPAPGCEAHPLAGAGWTLHPLGDTPQGRVDARWLDAADAAQRAELFAGLPATGQADADGDAAPFAWAHRALCRQGLRLRIGGEPGAQRGEAGTVWLQLRHQPRAAVEAPLLVIELQPGVQAVLVELHDREPLACGQPIVQNLQVHLRLGEGASLQHLRIVTPAATDQIAHHLHACLGRGARYEQALIASGSSYHLQRELIELQAARAVARSAGLLLAAGAALEQQVRVSHAAGRTTSAVEALALARGAARAVVNAHTHIAPGAAGAEARQRLVGIPTGGQPRLVLRPHLEIHHDDVQATHGATWGSLPEDALFYARQRGLDEATARGLIVEGMAAALLERCFGERPLPPALGLATLLQRAVGRHLAPTDKMPESSHG